MADYEITKIPPSQFDGQPVSNTFFHHQDASTCLAVMFPGQAYTCDMPLLYYTTEVMLQRRIDVLQLHKEDGEGRSTQEQIQKLLLEARSLVTAGKNYQNYQQLILVGKSLGTLVMAALATAMPGIETAFTIWQTPLFKQTVVADGALRYRSPALILASTGDSTYDADAVKRLQSISGAQVALFPDANHSLEYPGDLPRSLQTMQQVVTVTDQFLKTYLETS